MADQDIFALPPMRKRKRLRTRSLPPADRLRELLDYNPDVGELRWKVKVAKNTRIGAIAGCKNKSGYVTISIQKTTYLAHRVIWSWMTGGEPEHQIDHKSGDPSDNRWENLRAATSVENGQNSRMHSTNGHGFKGVTRNRDGWSFSVRITRAGFSSPETAYAGYCEAIRLFHKEFAKFE